MSRSRGKSYDSLESEIVSLEDKRERTNAAMDVLEGKYLVYPSVSVDDEGRTENRCNIIKVENARDIMSLPSEEWNTVMKDADDIRHHMLAMMTQVVVTSLPDGKIVCSTWDVAKDRTYDIAKQNDELNNETTSYHSSHLSGRELFDMSGYLSAKQSEEGRAVGGSVFLIQDKKPTSKPYAQMPLCKVSQYDNNSLRLQGRNDNGRLQELTIQPPSDYRQDIPPYCAFVDSRTDAKYIIGANCLGKPYEDANGTRKFKAGRYEYELYQFDEDTLKKHDIAGCDSYERSCCNNAVSDSKQADHASDNSLCIGG